VTGTRIARARHHIAKVRQGGGTADEIATAIRLTAWAVGGLACTFIAEHRPQHLPDAPVAERDRADRTTSAGSVALRIAVPAAAAVHAARGDDALLARAITFADAIAVPEIELAEALSIMMFPGSVPRFVEAARVRLGLIRAETVQPSPVFGAWARLQGQGGFDEAAAQQAARRVNRAAAAALRAPSSRYSTASISVLPPHGSSRKANASQICGAVTPAARPRRDAARYPGDAGAPPDKPLRR
jgi:hypothetical protein